MKKRQSIILIAAGIIVASFGISEYLGSLKEEPVVRKPPQAKKYVTTTPVRYKDLKTDVITFGRVENAQVLDLISEVSGRMSQGSVRLKEGESFKKGTLIYKINDEEASLNLKSQKSNFLRDLAGILPDLKIDFGDNYDKWQAYFEALDIEKSFPELPEVKSTKEKTFLATKGIYSSYYSIKSSEAQLAKYRYYAPFSGSIMEVAMQSGSFVNPGTRIGKILRSGVYEMKASVETRDIPWIQVGSPVEIYSKESQQYWKGEVTRISDYVNQNTQSVDVFITIYPNGQKIYDGQFFQAAIPARTVKDGMIMPRNAIYNGNEVFVLEDSLLKKKSINVVRLSEEDAIFNGLEQGQELVVEPLLGAYNNMKAFKRPEQDINLETGESNDVQLSSDAGQASTN
ncbi:MULTISPECIES: HlyD family efflux transporter periplasmic adaptor subunit [unclassified Ekhidna]|jgi:membrane fusion protein (multidrug efflux system)|uniref:efflux RND transporter periplasmic adaptor subunit n=1 Tax=unclassified Ekhidna TaxID=2632188 RepID=UPI0032DEBF59